MKNLLYVVSLCLFSFLPFVSGCQEDEPTQEELFLQKLGASWVASSTGVTLDDVSVNNVFKGFSIVITSESTFTTTNGNGPIWPSSGSFTLKKSTSAVGFDILRNDGVTIAVVELTDQKLILSFDFVGQPGRTKSVSGGYIFDLIKKP